MFFFFFLRNKILGKIVATYRGYLHVEASKLIIRWFLQFYNFNNTIRKDSFAYSFLDFSNSFQKIDAITIGK